MLMFCYYKYTKKFFTLPNNLSDNKRLFFTFLQNVDFQLNNFLATTGQHFTPPLSCHEKKSTFGFYTFLPFLKCYCVVNVAALRTQTKKVQNQSAVSVVTLANTTFLLFLFLYYIYFYIFVFCIVFFSNFVLIFSILTNKRIFLHEEIFLLKGFVMSIFYYL